MADRPRLSSPHCSTSEVAIQKWKTLFFGEIIKVRSLGKKFMPIR